MKAIRVVVYIVIVLALLGVVGWRFQVIEAEKTQELNSFSGLSLDIGKPINLVTINKDDLEIFEKVTGRIIDDSRVEVRVTRVIAKNIRVGQMVRLNSVGKENVGAVIRVASRPSLEDGLFTITINLPKKARKNYEKLIPLRIKRETVKNTITVPIKAMQALNGKFYVWTYENEKASKVEVKLGRYNQTTAEIRSGLSVGDQVIVNGHRSLKSDEKVYVNK